MANYTVNAYNNGGTGGSVNMRSGPSANDGIIVWTRNDPPLVVLISSILQQEGVLFHCLFSFKQSSDRQPRFGLVERNTQYPNN